MREAQVNRRQMNIGGLIITMLLLIGVVTLRSKPSNDSMQTGQSAPVSELAYCNDKETKPCVVSFGIDTNDNMLANLLLPDISFPWFYLQIMRGEVDFTYECKRVVGTPNNVYCSGEKLPPGEVLHLALISIRGDVILAEGNLSIIGLAFPTMEIAIPTDVPTETPTEPPTPLPTQPSYP